MNNLRIVLVGSIAIGLVLFNLTPGILGPYGAPSDVYHELILIINLAVLGLLYLLLRRKRA